MRVRSAILRQSGLARPYADSKPLSVETVTLAPPGHDEVLVRIAAAGVCHSDLSVINGDRPRVLPLALGHEASGVVEEVGPGVGDLAHRGQREALERAGDHERLAGERALAHPLRRTLVAAAREEEEEECPSRRSPTTPRRCC
jgi:hypothetical protein